MKNRLFVWLVLFSALPFGGNVAWAEQLMAVLLAVLGLLHVVDQAHEPRMPLSAIAIPLFLYGLPLIWAGLQINTSLPVSWQHPLYALTATALDSPLSGSISLWPDAGLSAILKLLSYGLIFVISFQIHQASAQVNSTLNNILYAGAAYAFYGLFSYFQRPDLILWFDCSAYCDVVHSTFINRNSYATFAGLTLLAGLPKLLLGIQGANRYGLSSHFGRHYFAEKLLISQWQTLLWMAVIATALLLTQSRGGFLSTLLALLVFFGLLQLSRKIKGHRLMLLAVVTAMLLLIFQRSGDKVTERLDSIDLANNDRLLVYELLSQASDQNPWFGLGLGSFEKTFRLFRDESIAGYFDKAHNTYLELIFELGYLQAGLLCLSVLLLALRCARGVWVRQRNWVYPAIGVSAAVLVGSHALVDFSLQIPAVSYLFALILGLAVAQAFPSASRR